MQSTTQTNNKSNKETKQEQTLEQIQAKIKSGDYAGWEDLANYEGEV